MQPHYLAITEKLYQARKLIFRMAEPMVRLQAMVEANLKAINEKQQYLSTSTEENIRLANSLAFEVNTLKTEILVSPVTVCTDARCVDIANVNGVKQIDYKRKCHDPCSLHGVTHNVIGNVGPLLA